MICFGASTQLDEMKPGMSDTAYATHRSEILRQLDRTLHGLMARIETQRATLILVSFSPPKSPSWDQLTPIVIYPAAKAGLLNSPTTRTPGLIAASDFAPTVLDLMHLHSSDDMVGRAAHTVPDGRAVARLKSLSERVTADQRLLLPTAVAIAALTVLSFTGAALLIAFRKRSLTRLAALCKIGMLIVACYPAAMLLAVLAPTGAGGYLGGAALALAVLVVACLAIARAFGAGRPVAPVVAAYVITSVVMLIDALTGCGMCKFSALSSYQIAGMRFYGIGNEYAALLIAMAALATVWLMSDVRGPKSESAWPGLVVLAVGAVVVLTFGLGGLGANYGATAAAVVTFGLLWRAVRKGGFGARHVVIAFAAAIAAVVLFAVLDWKLAGGAGSHAARATGLTEKLGGGYLGSIALRKVAFNLKTTLSVKGIAPMVAFTPFVALWFWGVQGKVREGIGNREQGTEGKLAGIKAVLVGAAAAYMLNDSGIVFGAVMVGMTVLVLLYSVLGERKDPTPTLPTVGRE